MVVEERTCENCKFLDLNRAKPLKWQLSMRTAEYPTFPRAGEIPLPTEATE
jgi:hypothetical protein